MEFITSKTNTRIKDICKLIIDKKYRQEKNLFVIEGIKLISEAAKNNVVIHSVLFTQRFLDANDFDIYTIIPEFAEKIIVSPDICKKMSINKSPQGIYAVCKIPKEINTTSDFTKALLLSSLQDPGNVGTIIRSADALGVKKIILTNDCPDIYNHKVIRATMGSIFRVQISYTNDVFRTINDFKSLGFMTYASALRTDSDNLTNLHFEDKILMVIGNEGQGLDQDVIDACDKSIVIPMSKEVDSLNVAVATGILMWEMLKEN